MKSERRKKSYNISHAGMATVFDLLTGKIIPVREELVAITGSVAQAMFLSQALYWQRSKNEGEWFWKTNKEWAEELFVSVRTFATMKEDMRASGFLEMVVRGVPAKTFYRVNVALILARIEASRNAEVAQPVVQQLHNKKCKPCTTNTENTQEITTEKFSFGKQREARTAADVLAKTKETLPEVIEDFEGRPATPLTVDKCFRRLWTFARTGRPLVSATNKRLAMLGKTAELIGASWPEVFAATVTQWEEFCGQVAADKGITRSPAIPSVEFMLAHVDVMVVMARQKPTETTPVVQVFAPKHRRTP